MRQQRPVAFIGKLTAFDRNAWPRSPTGDPVDFYLGAFLVIARLTALTGRMITSTGAGRLELR